MRDKTLAPLGPAPSWYERWWFMENNASPRMPSRPRTADQPIRGAALFALAFFSAAAACGVGLGHFHILYP